MKTITIGANHFVQNKAALVETLFAPGGTASGTFEKRSNGVMFFNGKGEEFAFLVANKHGERFFVSCSRQSDGQIWYMFALKDSDKVLLGMQDMGWIAMHEAAESIWASLNPPVPAIPVAA